jgi:hypothetical protein
VWQMLTPLSPTALGSTGGPQQAWRQVSDWFSRRRPGSEPPVRIAPCPSPPVEARRGRHSQETPSFAATARREPAARRSRRCRQPAFPSQHFLTRSRRRGGTPRVCCAVIARATHGWPTWALNRSADPRVVSRGSTGTRCMCGGHADERRPRQPLARPLPITRARRGGVRARVGTRLRDLGPPVGPELVERVVDDFP